MKDQIKMIVFVVILGSVAAAILVGTDNFTHDRIANNQEYALKSTILSAFELAAADDKVLDVYDQAITESEQDGNVFYYAKDGSVGFEFSGRGLWGPIDGFLTLEPDLVTIKGIQIIYNEETPGLGGVVAEQWYLNKYKGKQFDPEIIVSKEADPSSNVEVDAITGASMTSTFFQQMLNKSYQQQKEVLE